MAIDTFLSFTSRLDREAQIIARDRVVNDINMALAMMFYDYTIKGEQENLKKFDRENPFVPLSIYSELPDNYNGSIRIKKPEKGGWYFDLEKKSAKFYFSKDLEAPYSVYEMQYIFDDLNADGFQDYLELGQLKLVKIN